MSKREHRTNSAKNEAMEQRINRRRVVQTGAAGAAGIAAAGAIGSTGVSASQVRAHNLQATPEPRSDGRMRIAGTGQPAGLDQHLSRQRTVALISWNMYEALFTFDREYETVPMLAESYETSEDGLVYTITLRQGVPFHNGEEMTAADVVASFERWMPVSSLGLAIQPYFEAINAVDDYTVEINLTSPLVALPGMLARQAQGLSIHPASVLEAAGSDLLGNDQYIGTGPYQFVELVADQYTLLSRFEDYAILDSEPSGYAGAKNAYLDELEFLPVPDEAARIAGLQTGEYHYLEEIITDQVETFEGDPNVQVAILPPRSYGVISLNTAGGLCADVSIRRAVQACIGVEASGLVTHGDGYFELGPGIMMPQTVWSSNASADLYDRNNPEMGQQLLDEAGYDGTPLRMIATMEDLGDYNAAVVAQQQLEAGGFTVQLDVMDEATLDELLVTDDQWDASTGAYVFRPDPVLIAPFSSCNYDGQWCSDEKVAVVERLQTESDFDARYDALEDLQRLWYEQAPAIKLVNNYGVAAFSSRVQNFVDSTHFELEPEFSNCWLAPEE